MTIKTTASRRSLLLAAGALAAPTLWPAAARSQSPWPDRPIRLVVPFGAGGAIDTLSRTVAARFAEVTGGQNLVVENRAGAAGWADADDGRYRRERHRQGTEPEPRL
jgi:tripartite-type tricarboxylate transporter receptor subunit TctC